MKEAGRVSENQPKRVIILGLAGSHYFPPLECLRKGSSYKYSEKKTEAVDEAVGQELWSLVDKWCYDQLQGYFKVSTEKRRVSWAVKQKGNLLEGNERVTSP